MTRQQFIRGVNVIHNDIIASIQARRECNFPYGEPVLLEAYDQQIADLQEERRQSQLLGQQMFAELTNELHQNEIHGNVNVAEDNNNNNNVGTTDPETESSEPQQNIRRRVLQINILKPFMF